MAEVEEFSLRKCRRTLSLVLVFARGWEGLFAEIGYGKKQITQITGNWASPKARRVRLIGNSHVGVNPRQEMTNCS